MNSNTIEQIGMVLLLIFAAVMFYQGTMVLQNKHGYFQIDEGNRTKRMKSRLENLMKDK